MIRWIYPVDPECPVVAEFMASLFGDPMTLRRCEAHDVREAFEQRHRTECKRCQKYAAANIDIEELMWQLYWFDHWSNCTAFEAAYHICVRKGSVRLR